MANDIVIRKANKDYVCSCCGHIIRKGDEYLDKCIFNVGKIVKHDRYHDECPEENVVVKLCKKIVEAGGDLMASDSEGTKIHIIGVAYKDGEPVFLYMDWKDTHKKILSIDCIFNLLDANGNSII